MTARNSRGPHPSTLQPAISLDRLIRVVGARRVIAARWWEDLRERHLVTTNGSQHHTCHQMRSVSRRAACSVSSLRSANRRVSAAGRAIRTTSYRIPRCSAPESPTSREARAASRTRRLARLRSTAPLSCRLTVTPTLVSGPLRSEEHTSELQSLTNLVCRLLLEKK